MLVSFPDLTKPRDVVVKSDSAVHRAVAERVSKHTTNATKAGNTLAPAKQLSEIPELASPAWRGQLVPQEILQVLGEALTPILPTGVFELSRQWAQFRYFWAFAPIDGNNRRLRLSPEAHGLVDHHRTLSAEQLGIGIALQMGEWLIRERHAGETVDVRCVDADVALGQKSLDGARKQRVATAAGAPRRMRPDYFFTVEDRASRNVLVYALEAKGTHTPGHWIEQMAKGARQVAAARINNVPPTGFIFSTELSDEKVVVRALDPAGGEAWAGPAVRRDDAPIVREDPEVGVTVVERPDAFRHHLVRTADAALLSFTGQYGAAATLLRRGDQQRETGVVGDRPVEHADSPMGDVVFTALTLPLGEQELRIRTGAAVNVLTAARSEDADARANALTELEARLSAKQRTDDAVSIAWVRSDDDGRVVESMRPTGTYLRAEIREPGEPSG